MNKQRKQEGGASQKVASPSVKHFNPSIQPHRSQLLGSNYSVLKESVFLKKASSLEVKAKFRGNRRSKKDMILGNNIDTSVFFSVRPGEN